MRSQTSRAGRGRTARARPSSSLREDLHHPARALAARRALPARLVHVELRDAQAELHHAAAVVDHDHAGGADSVPAASQRVGVERRVDLVRRQRRHRRAARDDGLQLAAVRDPAAEVVDQLAQGRPQLELVVAAARRCRRSRRRAFRASSATPILAYSRRPSSMTGGTVAIVSTLLIERRRGVEARHAGNGGACAAGRACPRASRAAPSPRRRCRRRRRGARRSSPRRERRPRAPPRARRAGSRTGQVLAADVDEDAPSHSTACAMIRQPSISRCGTRDMISRSLKLPGSDSSALTTR